MAAKILGFIVLGFMAEKIAVTASGIKVGSGKVMKDATPLFEGLDKGKARQLRRELHRAGKGRMAKTGTRAYC